MQLKHINTSGSNPVKPLPKEYIPYKEIILCSNSLLNVSKILDDNGFNPLLVGRDPDAESPLVWLKSRSNDGFIELVKKNRPLLNIVSVNNYRNDKQLDVIIEYKGEKYILLQIEYDLDVPNITKLDLRPIGYNLFGDEEKLTIGTSEMIGNVFNTEILISM